MQCLRSACLAWHVNLSSLKIGDSTESIKAIPDSFSVFEGAT
jgi:hypothetical protein